MSNEEDRAEADDWMNRRLWGRRLREAKGDPDLALALTIKANLEENPHIIVNGRFAPPVVGNVIPIRKAADDARKNKRR